MILGFWGGGGAKDAVCVGGFEATVGGVAAGADGKELTATIPMIPAMVMPPATKVMAVAVERRIPRERYCTE